MRWTIQRSDESERVLAARVRDVFAGFVASGYVLAQDQTWTESNALALYDHLGFRLFDELRTILFL